jgi:hypothetical protein
MAAATPESAASIFGEAARAFSTAWLNDRTLGGAVFALCAAAGESTIALKTITAPNADLQTSRSAVRADRKNTVIRKLQSSIHVISQPHHNRPSAINSEMNNFARNRLNSEVLPNW